MLKICFVTILISSVLCSGVCQDRVVLANDDTLSMKILKYDDHYVEFLLQNESVASKLYCGYVKSIILSSGRVINPSLSEIDKLSPVFGKYKGNSRLTNEKEKYGLSKVGEGVYTFKTPQDMQRELQFAGQMLGASLVIVPIRPVFDGDPQVVGAEFFSFITPQKDFLNKRLAGNSSDLISLEDHSINQLLIVDALQSKTISHRLEFTMDGKILENGKESGTYKINDDHVEIKYLYTNKKGKIKESSGTFKIGSYDKDLILLYSANNRFSEFHNIILKRCLGARVGSKE